MVKRSSTCVVAKTMKAGREVEELQEKAENKARRDRGEWRQKVVDGIHFLLSEQSLP